MKPLLIGMHGSNRTRPGHELYPMPESGVGYRLWRMLNARTGATMKDYTDTFERRSLVRGGSFDSSYARIRAHDILCEVRDSGRTVLMLGHAVHEAFNQAIGNKLPSILIHPSIAAGCVWRQIPNVSCAWYDSDENRMLVEMLLEELFVRHNGRCLSDVTE